MVIMVLVYLSSSLSPMSGVNFSPIVAWKVQATSGSLNFSSSDLILGWSGFLAFFRRIERPSLPGHGHFLCLLQESSLSYTVKNIRRFYGKITGNQLPVYFPLFLQAPVNIFRNQAQNGSKGHYWCFFVFFCHTALQSYKGIFEYCRLT